MILFKSVVVEIVWVDTDIQKIKSKNNNLKNLGKPLLYIYITTLYSLYLPVRPGRASGSTGSFMASALIQ
jgi:hypothetical protein